MRWPYGKRITINLAPADVRKEGLSFDLPIALGMLKLEENNRLPALDAFCITGELALLGQLRPVKGGFFEATYPEEIFYGKIPGGRAALMSMDYLRVEHYPKHHRPLRDAAA